MRTSLQRPEICTAVLQLPSLQGPMIQAFPRRLINFNVPEVDLLLTVFKQSSLLERWTATRATGKSGSPLACELTHCCFPHFNWRRWEKKITHSACLLHKQVVALGTRRMKWSLRCNLILFVGCVWLSLPLSKCVINDEQGVGSSAADLVWWIISGSVTHRGVIHSTWNSNTLLLHIDALNFTWLSMWNRFKHKTWFGF